MSLFQRNATLCAIVILPVLLPGCTCSSPVSTGLPVVADRPILDWLGPTAQNANAKVLPVGFTQVDLHTCSKDPTREYLAELFTTGISDIEVNYHWAPVVAGPDPMLPTIDQPAFAIAGTVAAVDDSTDDFLADHPFGLDVNSDISLDPAYAFASQDPGDPATQVPQIHTEIETRLLPRDALGYTVAKGDREIEQGVWPLDCGHPPYEPEMHPPSFIAAARSPDGATTQAMAVYIPYRSSLLFTQNEALATAFSDDTRFSNAGVASFPQALVDDVVSAVVDKLDHLTAHALMVANRFDTLSFMVCAPLPRPAGASLDATWRFTARTGVQIEATPDDVTGCVLFTATMGPEYTPAPLTLVQVPWQWQDLDASASMQAGMPIDVRQAIISTVQGEGLDPSQVPALQPDHPPMIDAYPPLETRHGADLDAPTAIDTGADDQPYPFYGRVRAGWKT